MFVRVVVVAPPGALGIHLTDNETNEVKNVVTAVNVDSPLSGKVLPGDYIVTINGGDVHNLGATGEM